MELGKSLFHVFMKEEKELPKEFDEKEIELHIQINPNFISELGLREEYANTFLDRLEKSDFEKLVRKASSELVEVILEVLEDEQK